MEVDAAIEAIGFGFYQIKTLSVFFILQLADGCEVLLLAFLGNLLRCEWHLTPVDVASLTTAVFIGMLIGALILGTLADLYGRKGILYIACFIVVYSTVHSAFSPTFWWMWLLRGLAGFGIAGFLVINSTLLGEITPRDYRAFCQAVIFTGWGFGSIVIVGIGALVIPRLGWRYFLLTATSPVIIGTYGLIFVDESPRYLLVSGNTAAALALIKKMASQNRKEMPCKELKSVSNNTTGERTSFMSIFETGFLSATLLTSLMAFVAGFTYYGAVFLSAQLPMLNYVCFKGHRQLLHQQVADDSCCPTMTTGAYTSMAIAAVGDVIAGIVMTSLVDRFGRKIGMEICLIISAVLFLAPVFCMPLRVRDVVLLLLRCFTLTFCQITFVYMIEIFPTTIRTTAIGFCSLLKRIGGMLTPFIGQMLIESHTKISLLLYAVACLFGVVALLLFAEETSEYELFETVNHFSDRKSSTAAASIISLKTDSDSKKKWEKSK